tara:strand:+ start:459 stop:3164 length:2706 start_codon:yes stop_codon:yes gene_type:complete
MFGFIGKIFGTSNDRNLKRMQKFVDAINSLDGDYSSKEDSSFKELKSDLSQKFLQNNDLYSILPEAFAAVREAGKRTIGLRHFDAQMLGGIALAEGNIAEMKTGEGKTLVATLPTFLNSAMGNKVILVTVNDYLAKRDAEWMRPIYEFLGLSVGVIYSGQELSDKAAAYSCDVIYATNNELGFDYLRDNMALRAEDRVQCSLDFAIVDEVDSILIDEARTPLIISGPSNESSEIYSHIKSIVPKLKRQLREETEEEPLEESEIGHYIIDEKNRNIDLTDEGYMLVESLLEDMDILSSSGNLYSVSNIKIMRFVQATLRASFLYNRDVHYLVRNGEVVLIDEHTGRSMPGRRISEGVHQALECKENVTIQRESQTLASTTFQNFFRLFDTLSGMTGTADTEALEFNQIYGLNVVVIPTNKKMIRDDQDDLVFLSKSAKYKALIKKIEELGQSHVPVLVGTVSVESSEEVSNLLKKKNIPHQVLNAKQHEREAEVIANAGKPGVVTIATNMAGRGTDIVLGGKKEDNEDWKTSHQKVLDAGGLCILGTERHESRRIDNQLRGRSGRQGDPGSSQFFLSLEDDLLRLFITDSRRALFEKIGMGDDHIEHKMLSRGIENAQKRIENRNFDIRKNLLEYDDVANDQRTAIYALRNDLLEEDDIEESIQGLIEENFENTVYSFIPFESVESQWKTSELDEFLKENFQFSKEYKPVIEDDKSLGVEEIKNLIISEAHAVYKSKFEHIGEQRKLLEKQIMLQVLDVHWKEHLAEMDHLRQSVGLRAYAQKNPKNEYKREAFNMFENMLDEINSETIRILFNIKIATKEEIEKIEKENLKNAEKNLELKKNEVESQVGQSSESYQKSEQVIAAEKIGRNELVKITNGSEIKEIKYKKAKPLIEAEGWKII